MAPKKAAAEKAGKEKSPKTAPKAIAPEAASPGAPEAPVEQGEAAELAVSPPGQQVETGGAAATSEEQAVSQPGQPAGGEAEDAAAAPEGPAGDTAAPDATVDTPADPAAEQADPGAAAAAVLADSDAQPDSHAEPNTSAAVAPSEEGSTETADPADNGPPATSASAPAMQLEQPEAPDLAEAAAARSSQMGTDQLSQPGVPAPEQEDADRPDMEEAALPQAAAEEGAPGALQQPDSFTHCKLSAPATRLAQTACWTVFWSMAHHTVQCSQFRISPACLACRQQSCGQKKTISKTGASCAPSKKRGAGSCGPLWHPSSSSFTRYVPSVFLMVSRDAHPSSAPKCSLSSGSMHTCNTEGIHQHSTKK